MVEVAVLGDDPDQNFEVFLAPITLNAPRLLHSML